ncbi:unnamed protein product [Ranitomeya imitator]|uniref:Ig-like domain-containing protein n=1 Tax=Ranitomeya imitator TaxID=111125 RepID=A0ABN9LW13_9NEOB|nr:unnamed protein product [Ranitomeya imitator]
MFWRQNNSLFTLPSHYKQYMTSETLQLTIEKATKADSANYTCVALSKGNETIRVIELIVGEFSKLIIDQSKIQFMGFMLLE